MADCKPMISFQYCTLTWPDISFVVNKFCQFIHSPTTLHWQALKCFLRYLKDWATCPDDGRSTSSFCVFIFSTLISWSSAKQHAVSLSSTKAENRNVANGASEVLWILSLLLELHFPYLQCPIIY